MGSENQNTAWNSVGDPLKKLENLATLGHTAPWDQSARAE